MNCNGTKVTVTFSEPVDRETARGIANYAIDQGIDVLDARLENDSVTVTLTVTALTLDTTYTLTVHGVFDLADPPNTADDTYLFSPSSISRFNDDFDRPDSDTIGNGWIEKWNGSTWIEIDGGYYEDSSSNREGPGTVGFSDHTLSKTVYDDFSYRSLEESAPLPAAPSPAIPVGLENVATPMF